MKPPLENGCIECRLTSPILDGVGAQQINTPIYWILVRTVLKYINPPFKKNDYAS